MTKQRWTSSPDDEPTRQLDDASWFFSRETEMEQTKELPLTEPTQVIPVVEETRVIDGGEMDVAATDSSGSDGAGSGFGACGSTMPGVETSGERQPGGITPPPPPAEWLPPGHAAAFPSPTTSPAAFAPAPGTSSGPAVTSPWGASPAQPSPSGSSSSGSRRSGLGTFAVVFVTGALGAATLLNLPSMLPTALPGGPRPVPQPVETDEGQWGQPGSEQEQDQESESGQDATGRSRTEPQTGATGRASQAQSKGVMLIETTSDNGRSAGTGMVVASDGYVLTNYHVVQASTRVSVRDAASTQTWTASVVGHDASNDVALLKLEGAENLETVAFDEDGVEQGELVTAVGNSNGQGFLSSASGTVVETSSEITVGNENSATGTERLTDVLRTTVNAQRGDSGGPMVDVDGEVVGMTTAGRASSGINTRSATVASYAVPIERAMGIVEKIRAGQEEGTVVVGPRAFLGLSVTMLPDGRLEVVSVVQGGAAQRAGLAEGDVLTSFDGDSLEQGASLSEALAHQEPGDEVRIGWIDTAGEQQEASVELGSSPVN